MRNDISQKIKEYAKTNPAIESIFYVKRLNNDEFYSVYTVANEIIIAKLEEEFKGLFDDVIFVNRVKEKAELDKNKFSYTTINLYKMDNIKVSESIISSDIAKDFIKTLPTDIEFLYNKAGSEALLPNKEFIYNPVKEYEFSQTVKNFFAYAIEISLYLNQNNTLAAAIRMENLRDELIKMLRIHVVNNTRVGWMLVRMEETLPTLLARNTRMILKIPSMILIHLTFIILSLRPQYFLERSVWLKQKN